MMKIIKLRFRNLDNKWWFNRNFKFSSYRDIDFVHRDTADLFFPC